MMNRRLAAALFVAVAGATASAQVPQGLEAFDKAWTEIRDTHFDKTMNGVDWDAVRTELRPRAEAAKNIGEVRLVIRDMLARLGQSHFALIPSSADSPHAGSGDLSGDIGFDVRPIGPDIVVSAVEKGSPAEAAGVRAGWRVVGVGGASLSDALRAVPQGSPERLALVEAWRIAETRLRGPSGSSGQITFEDAAGKPVVLSIERRHEQGESVTVGSLPTMYVRVESDRVRTPGGRDAGLIRFNVWMVAVNPLFGKAIDQFRLADGIVIDLRGNPGGLAAMIMAISGHFLDEPKVLGLMRTRDNTLKFAANPQRVNASGERVTPYGGPVALLVDAMTGSASECFAGGMQSIGRARVFGQTSMGQALPAFPSCCRRATC